MPVIPGRLRLVREGTDPNQCVKVTKYDTSYDSMMNGCYWDYMRVYVPAGSTLRSTSGFSATSDQLDSNNFPTADAPVSGQENGRTYFAAQLIVPPGHTVTVTLNYVLPGTLPDKPLYRLDVELQAGAKASPAAALHAEKPPATPKKKKARSLTLKSSMRRSNEFPSVSAAGF